ncbi:hypothetical protein JCM15519_26590 [Fundidesulfovibrio butyratiphilus]
MICTKCGADNPDEATACQVCGHKLQSPRDPRPSESAPTRREPVPLLNMAPRGKDPGLRPYREAWLVGLGVAGAAFVLLGEHLAWPVYPVVALAAGYAWLRGLR